MREHLVNDTEFTGNDGKGGSENTTTKLNSLIFFFNVFRVYSKSLKMANEGKFPWTTPKFGKRLSWWNEGKVISGSCRAGMQGHQIEISTKKRAARAKICCFVD